MVKARFHHAGLRGSLGDGMSGAVGEPVEAPQFSPTLLMEGGYDYLIRERFLPPFIPFLLKFRFLRWTRPFAYSWAVCA
jgi:hypothetical protein